MDLCGQQAALNLGQGILIKQHFDYHIRGRMDFWLNNLNGLLPQRTQTPIPPISINLAAVDTYQNFPPPQRWAALLWPQNTCD
jgi:hypothetical protein